MSESEDLPALHRILVALDGDESAQAALESAASLAAALEAELVGLFVEDTDLLHAAELPMTWSISRQAGGRTALDAAAMGRALRVSAGQAGAAVAAVAERLRIKSSFRVLRGGMAEQVLTEARACNLLALGASGEVMRRARVEIANGLMAMQTPEAVLLTHGRGRPTGPVVVLYDGSARALALGLRLAGIERRRLVVAAVGATEAEAVERQQGAAAWLMRHDQRATIRRIVIDEPQAACGALRREYPGMLVVDRRGPLSGQIPVDALLKETGCSIFLLK
jgi:nucleotide-binding universal stress UspA family protein